MRFSMGITLDHTPQPWEIRIEGVPDGAALFAGLSEISLAEAPKVREYLGDELFVRLARARVECGSELLRALKEGAWTPEVVVGLLVLAGGRPGGGIFGTYYDLPRVEVRGKVVRITPDTQQHVGRWVGGGGVRIKRMREVAATAGWRVEIVPPEEEAEAAKAERRSRRAEFEARVAQQRAIAEANRPTREAAEATRVKEVQRQGLLKKKGLLERKLKEQEGTEYEERILEFLLKVEEELAALEKGGEFGG